MSGPAINGRAYSALSFDEWAEGDHFDDVWQACVGRIAVKGQRTGSLVGLGYDACERIREPMASVARVCSNTTVVNRADPLQTRGLASSKWHETAPD
jgi:hypothetical protein